MEIDFYLQDTRGITEITKEELDSPEMKEMVKIAGTSLEMVVKKLCRRYSNLYPAIHAFEFVPVKEEIVLETDGFRMFYQPEKICQMYYKKELNKVEEQYFHILGHALLGHLEMYQALGEDSLWEAVMDYEVENVLGKMNYWGVVERKNISSKSMGIRSLYWYAKKRKSIEEQLKSCRSEDNHAIWGRKGEEKIGSYKIDSFTEGESGDKKNLKQKWENIRALMGMGKGKDADALRGMLQKTEWGWGCGSSGQEQEYTRAEENGNSYIEYLIEFFREREVMKEKDGTIDKMLYAYGFEIYGNVAFIEPEEYSEDKMMNTMVIAIDTSGSCSGRTMNEFLRETATLLQDVSEHCKFERIILMQCDAKIQEENSFYHAEELPTESSWCMRGFGGTDFRPVFERIKELQEQEEETIECLIYLSDGYGDFPKEEPGYPVLFVLPGKCQLLPQWVVPVYYKEIFNK